MASSEARSIWSLIAAEMLKSMFFPEVLRDCYGDRLLRANLTQQIKDSLFGHKPASARASYEISAQTVYDSYVKAFPYMSCNGGLQTKKDLEQLENTVRGLSAQVTSLTNAFAVITQFLKEKYGLTDEQLTKRSHPRELTDKEAEEEAS